MDIKEVYNNEYLVTIDKKVYEKLRDIYFFETTGKKQVMKNIDETINMIYDKTNIKDILIKDSPRGYYITYFVNGYFKEIFCYTITEVVIHLNKLCNK